jgi:hypothetical protein
MIIDLVRLSTLHVCELEIECEEKCRVCSSLGIAWTGILIHFALAVNQIHAIAETARTVTCDQPHEGWLYFAVHRSRIRDVLYFDHINVLELDVIK